MSELQKYECYYKDDLGYEGPALSRLHEYGSWYSTDDVDARLAKLEAENAELKIQNEAMHGAMGQQIDRLQRAVEWLNQNAELSTNEDGVHLTVLDASKQYRHWLKVPAEFAAIIKPAREE